MAKEKFSSIMKSSVLGRLKNYARSSKRNIADVLTEAAAEHLDRIHVHPIFRKHADDVMNEHDELLNRLAK